MEFVEVLRIRHLIDLAKLPRHAGTHPEPGKRQIYFAGSGLLDAARSRIRDVVTEPQTPQLICPERRLHESVPGL